MSGESAAPLRLVRGDASAEEVAAIVAVLASGSGADGPGDEARPSSRWASAASRLRTAGTPGPNGWRDALRR